ncbi:MAG: 50S ribosomal protein L10 [Omnitrophica WOR_2 bacterium RIFCSPHIGHO2_02_FULL_48_11]|nr:MAG: 50S ribosomal protein L10 [Omnitrophica WOR_2 bacterium RIFCSPHIGHO2_02_FULL_48_11]
MKVGKIFREKMTGQVKAAVGNTNVFLVSYKNISGPQMNTLRKDLKKIGAQMYVSRNSLIQLALKSAEQEVLSERVKGQTALIWGNTDSAVISKLLVKFTKDFEGIALGGGLFDGKLLEKDDIKRLSELPSREVLLAMLLRTMLSPATQFAGVLNSKTRDLLSIMKQLSEKKGGN